MPAQHVVIDDIHESLKAMSPLGRDCVGDAAEGLREAVLAYATRRGWFVLPYRLYAAWASECIKNHLVTWIVLDPLLKPAEGMDRCRFVRVTRTSSGLLPSVPQELDEACKDITASECGIMDDAASWN